MFQIVGKGVFPLFTGPLNNPEDISEVLILHSVVIGLRVEDSVLSVSSHIVSKLHRLYLSLLVLHTPV